MSAKAKIKHYLIPIHSGEAKQCGFCNLSNRVPCPYCEHKLTGTFSKDGRTTCQNCGKSVWLGIGNAND